MIFPPQYKKIISLSFKVTDLELHLITNPDEYPVVVHGTYKRFIQPIKQQVRMSIVLKINCGPI